MDQRQKLPIVDPEERGGAGADNPNIKDEGQVESVKSDKTDDYSEAVVSKLLQYREDCSPTTKDRNHLPLKGDIR
jgi:hypothetical protein